MKIELGSIIPGIRVEVTLDDLNPRQQVDLFIDLGRKMNGIFSVLGSEAANKLWAALDNYADNEPRIRTGITPRDTRK